MPSTVISSFSYNKEESTLKIVFITGTVYDYLMVPERIYLDMKNAFSKGIYFNQFIKDKYSFNKIK